MIARILLALGLAGVIALAPDGGTTAQAGSAASVGLGLREYSITVYRPKVRAGRVVLNLKNFGEDAHDVKVFGPRSYESAVSPEVAPFGGTGRLRVTLKRPGAYRLVCTVADHAALGMTAKLRVTKPS